MEECSIGICPICLEERELQRAATCRHEFCFPCLARYVKGQIAVRHIPCPQHPCNAWINESAVEQILGPEGYTDRGQRLKLLGNSLLRACPWWEQMIPLELTTRRCDALTMIESRPSPYDITCSNCSRVYCTQHGPEHLHEPCASFTERTATNTEVDRISKPCPHCGQAIELAAGCTHVVCPLCRRDFCFSCGNPNLSGTFVRSCPQCNMGYVVHRYLPLWFLVWILLLPCWVLFSSVALVFVGLGLLVAIVVRCQANGEEAYEVFLFIFAPFVFILDMAFQSCHCACRCGMCECPLPATEV